MRYTKLSLATLTLCFVILYACEPGKSEAPRAEEPLVKGKISKTDLVKRGAFLVSIGGCNDCHSPKKMSQFGPVVDTAHMLSGHPATEPLPAIAGNPTKPGNWILMGPDATAFVGPWGISYPANLTSDSATGIGAWTEAQFIQTFRTGKHLGLENGRPILPPMPSQAIGNLPDEDLRSLFAYLQSLPAVSNRVPGAVTPDKVGSK